VVLLIEAGELEACPAGKAAGAAARLQSLVLLVAVLSGPFTVPEIERVREARRCASSVSTSTGPGRSRPGSASHSFRHWCFSTRTERCTKSARQRQHLAPRADRPQAPEHRRRIAPTAHRVRGLPPPAGQRERPRVLPGRRGAGRHDGQLHPQQLSPLCPSARGAGLRAGPPRGTGGFVAFSRRCPRLADQGFFAAAGATPDFVLRDHELRSPGGTRSIPSRDARHRRGRPDRPVPQRLPRGGPGRLYRPQPPWPWEHFRRSPRFPRSARPGGCTRRPARSCARGSRSSRCCTRSESARCCRNTRR
jgi:hypothetical protein